MLPSIRYRHYVRRIVAATPLFLGWSSDSRIQKCHSAEVSMGLGYSYTVHTTNWPVYDEWVAVFTPSGLTTRASLYRLGQVLNFPAPAALATV
jgi:hypothetical protein